MRTRDLFSFIHERHAIYIARFGNKQPKPWTNNPILQRYRFCNVYRELDTVTQWIAKNWREPHRQDPYLFFAMCVARLVNWPESLEAVGYPVPWNPKDFWIPLEVRRNNKEKVFTGAYLIRADAYALGSKVRYLAERVLTPIWEDRDKLKPVKGTTLAEFHERLTRYRDMGNFMAGQVIADLKYAGPLGNAKDWWAWAAPGPGSERGLARVLEKDPKYKWPTNHWHYMLLHLQLEIDPLIKKAGMPRLHAQDLQNCLCEFDKYERVRLGEGRPRALYPGV